VETYQHTGNKHLSHTLSLGELRRLCISNGQENKKRNDHTICYQLFIAMKKDEWLLTTTVMEM
jgi:hypothetical protein